MVSSLCFTGNLRSIIVFLQLLIYYSNDSFCNARHICQMCKKYYLGGFGVSIQTYNQKNLKNTAVTNQSADQFWWFHVSLWSCLSSGGIFRWQHLLFESGFKARLSSVYFITCIHYTLMLHVNIFYSIGFVNISF